MPAARTETQTPVATLQRICERCQLTPAARALVSEPGVPEVYLTQLERAGLTVDAITFCANWLSSREAVWWGCLCAWHVQRTAVPAASVAAYQAIVRWLREPTEPNRRALEAAARGAGVGSPAGSLALAGFVSTGSIAPPNCPAVEASPSQSHTIVAGAVQLAAVSAASCRPFFLLASDVAHHRLKWT